MRWFHRVIPGIYWILAVFTVLFALVVLPHFEWWAAMLFLVAAGFFAYCGRVSLENARREYYGKRGKKSSWQHTVRT